jgi:NAD-dependent SIR2 family protein deacetylase
MDGVGIDPVRVEQAAQAIASANALLVAAGAGMGVDSGLPDFRGNEGFWNAYPPFRAAGLSFYDLAVPHWFDDDPTRAWGFYGHRRNLYRATAPHAGFAILKKWCDAKSRGHFVFTSNVDGHFQRAGFAEDAIVECHGSLAHLQCVRGCKLEIWEADDLKIDVDPATFRAAKPLPRCPHCDKQARPNVLMFGDYGWLPERTEEQLARMQKWLSRQQKSKLAIVELGAGTAVPTVRLFCEDIGATLIRINIRESEGPQGTISIAGGALEALKAIDALICT